MSGNADAGGIGLGRPWDAIVGRGELAIALVRHGRTPWNAERRFLGVTDIPLDDVGERQARALARHLGQPFARVYASPLRRARATAEAFGVAPALIPELAELHQGDLEGLPWPEAAERYPDFFRQFQDDPGVCRPPGGECLADCRDRALGAIERIARAHAPGHVVGVFTHQMVIASVTCALVGDALARWRSHGIGNGCVTVLAWDGERLAVEARGWGRELHPDG